MNNPWVWIGVGFLFGSIIGAILVYKVEINTINDSFDSLSFCYENYAFPLWRYEYLNKIDIPTNLSYDEFLLWNNQSKGGKE